MSERQYKPKSNNSQPVVDIAIGILLQRDKAGVETYGIQLQPDNGRDFHRDAMEEIADFYMYAVGWLMEKRAETARLRTLDGSARELLEAHRRLKGNADDRCSRDEYDTAASNLFALLEEK